MQTQSAATPHARHDARDLTFVLGHEIQHGFNDAARDQSVQTFLSDVTRQARAQTPVHDYTDELRSYLDAARQDEAKAEIAGWNALLSLERQSVPAADLDHMLVMTRNSRVRDFVQPDPSASTAQATARPGLTFNPDSTLSQTPGNIAAMGQHYFDRPSHLHAQLGDRPVGLGEHRPNPTADYANYYGTWALEQIVAAEHRANVIHAGARPMIAIDMAGLGLKEDLIEKEGLDLGASKAPRPYLDTSQTPAVQGRFDHTQDGSVNPRHDHQHVPVGGHHPATLLQDPITPDQPGHPDHALLEKLRGDVRHLDANAGKGWDTASERLAASALVMAKEKGFTAQDDLQLAFNTGTPTLAPGELLHLYRQGPSASPDPAANRACIRTLEALATPVDARYEQADAAGIARDRTQAQQVEQQHRVMQDEGARAHHAGGM